jgi:outer membrane lipoprotein-sorting protein
MPRDLEIDELTRKIESLEGRFKQTIPDSSQKKRKRFKGINMKQRDIFISMNNENKYREFEQWLLMKTI